MFKKVCRTTVIDNLSFFNETTNFFDTKVEVFSIKPKLILKV